MSQRIRSLVLAAALVAGTGVLGGATPASAAPVWNPNGTIRPGVQTVTSGSGQCTANFVFYDSSNNVYIGQSAHCASTGGPTDTNGCITGSQPIGTNVTISGATRPGKLVYSSWIAMKSDPSRTSEQCAYNDFAIVKLDPADYGRVNPSLPFWGGPQGVNTTGLPARSYVYTYGNSGLRLGLSPLSPKVGLTTTTTTGSSWRYSVYTVSPGIPGDSGSAFVDRNGRALGTLSTLGADGSNGVMNLNLGLAYLRSHSAYSTLQVANGLTTFDPIV